MTFLTIYRCDKQHAHYSRAAALVCWLSRWLFAALRRSWYRYRLSRTRRDPNMQCPACGARKGKIVFSQPAKVVLHQCSECSAMWAEAPIFDAEKWIVREEPPSQ